MTINLQKISEFDLSKQLTGYILIAIFVGYLGFSIPELWTDECFGVGDCYDFDRRMSRLAVWDVDWIKTDFRHVLHFVLLILSYEMFGNYKILVLTSSFLLLVITYLFTLNLTKKRFGAIIALLVVLQSSIFYRYDVSVTYPSFWALLFILSIYLITTSKKILSPISYVFSIPAKAVTVLYLPGILAYLWLDKRKKLLIIYFIIAITGYFVVYSSESLSNREVGGYFLIDAIDHEKFVLGFVSWMWKGFGSDQSTLLIFVIVSFLLFMNRHKIPNSKPILALSASIVFISPVLIGMTTYDVWPYRLLPLVVLIGSMCGILVSNLDKVNFSMFKFS